MKYYKFILVAVLILFIHSCGEDESNIDDVSKNDSISLIMSFNSRANNDLYSVNQDNTFSSLAIFLFDSSNVLEKYALLPSFSSTDSKELPISTYIQGNRTLYVIANYASKIFYRSNGTAINLNASTTKADLDNIITLINTDFAANDLLMINRSQIDISSQTNNSLVNIPLRRLQARIDLHVFKGSSFLNSNVTFKSVVLRNQVRNSEIVYDYTNISPHMLAAPALASPQINSNVVLQFYASGSTLTPSAALAHFYSYQNIVTQFSPLQSSAPYLEITVQNNGSDYTYSAYITDLNQSSYKYSLLQNNVYQVKATVENNAKLDVDVNVLPWSNTEIEYNRPIVSGDFVFAPWPSSWGGINGKTMNLYGGNLEDAVFSFELKRPLGASWVASLTNGLDFTFAHSTAVTTNVPVSKGVTNPNNPYTVAVRATKLWKGDIRETDFYIMVEGKEIIINPLIGSTRQYDGTDTRIRIKQVASYN